MSRTVTPQLIRVGPVVAGHNWSPLTVTYPADRVIYMADHGSLCRISTILAFNLQCNVNDNVISGLGQTWGKPQRA